MLKIFHETIISNDNLINQPKVKFITHKFFLILFFSLAISAICPLEMVFYGFQIYTPYPTLLIMAPFALFVWLLRPHRIKLRKEEVIFIITPLLILLTSTVSINPNDAAMQSLIMVYPAIIFLIVKYYLRMHLLRRNDLILLAFIVFFILTVLALFQYAWQEPIGVVANYFGDKIFDETYSITGKLRVSGTFTNANVFAQVYTIYSAIVVASCLFYFRSPRPCLAVFVSALSLFIVVTSLSRSGLLFAIFCQFSLYVYWIKCGRLIQRIWIIIATLFISIVIITSTVVIQEKHLTGMERITDLSETHKRTEVYLVALYMLQEPRVAFAGVGSGQFFEGTAARGIYHSYKAWLDPTEINSSVHNLILQLATENGIIIMLLYMYTVIKTVKRGWLIRKVPEGWFASTLAIILGSLYLTALQFGTTGTSPWILTPVAIIFVWIQNEYDKVGKQLS